MNLVSPPHIGVAVYNEGNHLQGMLSNLKNAILSLKFKTKPLLFICFNACNDNSIPSFLNTFEDLKEVFIVHILSSRKGKLRAHQKIIEHIPDKKPVLFIDSDIIVTSKAIQHLLDVLREDKKILVASAYPYLAHSHNPTLYQRIVSPIINIKRIYPQIEVCKYNTDIFHPHFSSDFERRSRVYFHGRCFIIKHKGVYEFPKDSSQIVGDDTFLSFQVLSKYPPGSIKVLYEARVFSRPQLSIQAYIRSWHRIRKDIDNIYGEYPHFLNLKKFVEMKINWSFVLFELNFLDKTRAILFSLLKSFEILHYHLSKDKISAARIWAYDIKEGF